MRLVETVSEQTIKELQSFDTCLVSNAIEQFGVRLRNEGFMNATVRCLFPDRESCVGYAVTARVRTSSTPVKGPCYFHRLDWWSYVETIPKPRFIVLKDADHVPGVGALVGEIHATICASLGCTAIVTNGAIRDLPGVEASGLQVFAAHLAVSHAYAHVADFGEPVELAGLVVKPGDLLQGDRHGVLHIPKSIASQIPATAHEIRLAESEFIDFCKSRNISVDELSQRIERLLKRLEQPGCPPDQKP